MTDRDLQEIDICRSACGCWGNSQVARLIAEIRRLKRDLETISEVARLTEGINLLHEAEHKSDRQMLNDTQELAEIQLRSLRSAIQERDKAAKELAWLLEAVGEAISDDAVTLTLIARHDDLRGLSRVKPDPLADIMPVPNSPPDNRPGSAPDGAGSPT